MPIDIKEIAKKYKTELDLALGTSEPTVRSIEYQKFKNTTLPKKFTLYEKLCNYSEKLLKISPDKKTSEKLQEAIETCHLNAKPSGVLSLAVVVPIILILFGALFSVIIPSIIGADVGMATIAIFLILGISAYFILMKMPIFMANSWRLKASNEMVLSIFYIVTYMRHTSNLENAIQFASEHLNGPLALDLKKVLWDVETEKYQSIKESLDNYLMGWKATNMEYVEAFHLIESSLYESSNDRRIGLLEKSLDVILEETYEKMMHYAYNLKQPITMLHMLGVVMPILGLVILPLVVSFMTGGDGKTKGISPMEIAFYISALYNFIIPIVIFYFGKQILSQRPTGYGATDLGKRPGNEKYENVIVRIGKSVYNFTPIMFGIILCCTFLLIGLFPVILHTIMPNQDIILSNIGTDQNVTMYVNSPSYPSQNFPLLWYKESKSDPEKIIGPYGLAASILSLCIPLAFAIAFGIYYKKKTGKLMIIKENTKKLEDEFASALFQLGNRIGDGIPVEIAFQKVARIMEGTMSGNFFAIVNNNIDRLGMSVQDAIFDPKVGALVYYPSNLIESSMKVLVESSKKGPMVAAAALINVSRYIKEIHKVDERLKDLMEENISGMKSQISFLAPVIAGVVVGITSMVTFILLKLSYSLTNMTSDAGSSSSLSGIMKIFGDGLPTYHIQIIVGLYIVEIVFLLTVIENTIENGDDKLSERDMLGKNLIRSSMLYVTIALIVMILFTFVAASVIPAVIAT